LNKKNTVDLPKTDAGLTIQEGALMHNFWFKVVFSPDLTGGHQQNDPAKAA
jgi:hypothetical protein